MKTSLFDFTLPDALIATEALARRDASRMLVVNEHVHDDVIQSLPEYLHAGDVLVLNNTKVIPARLRARRGDAAIELLLLKSETGKRWTAFTRPGKKLKTGDILGIAEDFSAKVLEKYADGQVLLEFSVGDMQRALAAYGEMPLPPYIEKNRKANAADVTRYQTIFADEKRAHSVAAPTAGLHFTEELLEAIKAKGVEVAYVTLHVGAGTFLPVKVEDTREHVMHAEFAELSEQTAKVINEAKARGGRVVAVGTTTLRTLESAALVSLPLEAYAEETRLFITPGFEFKVVDVLLTNFHLPKSTLFMLVSAFSGREKMLTAYTHAIGQKYRFYSYGDACLLFRKN